MRLTLWLYRSQSQWSWLVLLLLGTWCLVYGSATFASGDQGDANHIDAAQPAVSLCAWQYDYAFFTGSTGGDQMAEKVPCDEGFLPSHVSTDGSVSFSTHSAQDRETLESELRILVSGYPIETMVPTIAEYDREVAGLIVGIAKKESNWGRRVPRTESGEDCFNYWGYKGAGSRGVAMGHGCFGETAEAVHAIGRRLQELIAIRQSSEPASLTVWKCGSSCAGHAPGSVSKWIADVDIYFRAIARK